MALPSPRDQRLKSSVDRKLQVALIGYGLAGRVFHAPLISAAVGLNLAAIVTRSQAEQARKDHPEANIVGSVDDLLKAAPAFDLVVVATPNDSHVPLAIKALSAGSAVVIDKPAALSVKEMQELLAVKETTGRFLSIFQNRRWDGDFLSLKEIVSSGAIGKTTRFESRFERYRTEPKPGGWREVTAAAAGGGILLDLGSHLIDQAVNLFGQPLSVYAEIKRRRQAVQGDDDVFVALEFKEEVIAHLWMSMLAPSPAARFRLSGWLGSFEKWGLDRQEDALRSGLRPDKDGWLEAISGETARLTARVDSAHASTGQSNGAAGNVSPLVSRDVAVQTGNYLHYYQAVAACLSGSAGSAATAPVNPVSGEEALTTIKIIELARQSSSLGKVMAFT